MAWHHTRWVWRVENEIPLKCLMRAWYPTAAWERNALKMPTDEFIRHALSFSLNMCLLDAFEWRSPLEQHSTSASRNSTSHKDFYAAQTAALTRPQNRATCLKHYIYLRVQYLLYCPYLVSTIHYILYSFKSLLKIPIAKSPYCFTTLYDHFLLFT